MALTLVALKTLVAMFLFTFGAASSWFPTSPGISEGTSLRNRRWWESYERNYTVTCVIDVENWTRFRLSDHVLHQKAGTIITRTPGTIRPGTREAFALRMIAGSETGVWGTVSWIIEYHRRRLVVMFSTPWRTSKYSNWMGMGLTRKRLIRDDDPGWWDQMYYRSNITQITFLREEFYKRTEEVVFSHDEFRMTGIMTNGLNARILVKLMPTAAYWQRYAADSVKNHSPYEQAN